MKNGLLRHTLATIDYRFRKSVDNSGSDFADFNAGHGVRTPHEIIKHMRQVLDFAKAMVVSEKVQVEKIPDANFEMEVFLFNATVLDLDDTLSQIDLDLEFSKKILQGPFADVLTHIGQLAMLRRLSGGEPIEAENFSKAKIDPPSQKS